MVNHVIFEGLSVIMCEAIRDKLNAKSKSKLIKNKMNEAHKRFY